MSQRNFQSMWCAMAVALAIISAITISLAWQDERRPRAWLSSYGHVEPPGRTANPGALAAVTLLFSCSGRFANQCWDTARNEMRDHALTSRQQTAPTSIP